MHKKLLGLVGIAAFSAVTASQSIAQVSKGYSDVGFVVGLGNIGGANASVGGRYENVFKNLPDLGNGMLGFMVSADIYSFERVRFIPVGATMNYHFRIDPSNKVDLFLGAGLGFRSVNCSTYANNDCGYTSGLYVIGRAGGRYFLKPNLALYGDLGAGASTVNIGLTFKLK
ncbi:MAG: hypothetical protein H7305_02985 [Gemmatimonadaceae bacterium]|nr:hypothetical protein [Gemmatimonadaceae bacterium]